METILTSLGLGLLATTSPCVLPLYPGYLAYLSSGRPVLQKGGGRYLLGFFVLAGVLTMMLALGGVIALLSVSVGRALSIVIPVADVILLTLGMLLILDKNPFKALPTIQAPLVSHPFVNAFVYGLLYGPIALPCSGALVVGIFAYSFTAAELLDKLSVFFWFGMGFGLPLLALSFLSGALQRRLTRLFAQHGTAINRIGGFLLIGLAVYDFYQNREMILAFLVAG